MALTIIEDGIIGTTTLEAGRPVTRAVLWPPVECPQCHTMKSCVVIRMGRTLCMDCDQQEAKA